MSGWANGVQAKLNEKVSGSDLFYVHCHAHRLNLVLIDQLKAIPCISEALTLIQSLFNSINGSNTRHELFMRAQDDLKQTRLELERPGIICWFYWYTAVKRVKERYDAIIAVLTVTAEHQSIANGSSEANGYRIKMMKFEFILCLFLLESVLMKTHCLSVQLQGEGIDAVYAADLIQTVEEALLGCRSDQEYCQMQKQASDFAQKVGVDCAVPSNDESTLQTKRVRETSKNLIDYLGQSSTGERPSNTPATFKETVYFPCLDKIIDEFRRRFSDNAALLSSLVCFDPKK